MDAITAYSEFTEAVVDFAGMSRPMLHMHIGMAIYLGAELMLGTRRSSFLALLVVLEFELLNEVMNRLHYGSWRWPDTLVDLVLTLFWPAACFTSGKIRRWRWQLREEKARARKNAAQDLLSARGPALLATSD